MSLASLFVAAALMSSQPVPAPDDAPRVVVAQGALVGRQADGIRSFKGVPYAQPPIGDLRWRPPQPLEDWSGERDAGRVGALCIQPPANGDNGVGPLPMSEDCLTLNVWAPEGAKGPLPVMFWIHGGGLNNGSGTAALYDGTNLAKRGVVVVTINYRLGRLGFFDHPALAAERTAFENAGNYGLMDVIEALRWVSRNAEAFGGDPDNVTIFGESAGGALVTRLMISPEAEGLFHRAVVQSGLGRDEGTPLSEPRRDGGPSLQARGEAFAKGVGLADATAADLRALPAEALLKPAPNFYGGDLLVRDAQPKRGALSFHAVVEPNTPGALALPDVSGGEPVWIDPHVVVSGRRLTSTHVSTDAAGKPAIGFRLDGVGARQFATYTQAHVGEAFAVVLDGKVLAAPVIRDRIEGGSGLIEGRFTAEQVSEYARLMASDMRNDLIAEDVESAFAGGREAPVPLIIGTNSAEFWWMKPTDLSPYGEIDDALTPAERSAFHAAYGGEDGYNAQVVSDLAFNEPARHLARLHAANGHPTYLYRFDVVSAAMPEPHAGATHASERQYVFDNLSASPWPTAAMDQRAADAMAGYWTRFATTGDPNGGASPAWPEFGAEPDRLLEFTNDGPEAKAVPFRARLDLIEAYYGRVRP